MSGDATTGAGDALSGLDERAAARRRDDLAARIAAANRAYFQDDAPYITDAAYDALKRELLALEARFPHLVKPDSPTAQIGAEPAEGFSKITHAERMLSLANAFDAADVADFVTAIRRYLG